MFFNYKHLDELGYKICGLPFNSLNSCYHYMKYFEDTSSIVCFSTVHFNRVMVYKLTPEEYESFIKGKFALSHDGKGRGKSPTGYEIKNCNITVVFSGGELKNRKQLKEYLNKAEEIAVHINN